MIVEEAAWRLIAQKYDTDELKKDGFKPDLDSDTPLMEQVEAFIWMGEIEGRC